MAFSLRRRAEPLPVLVAAAEAVDVANFAASQSLTLSRQPWQNRAYGYFDDVGEIHFAARYVGNALAKIRLIGAEAATSQTDAPQETANQVVKDAIAKLKSPMGGQGGFVRAIGINIFIAGECFLLGREVDGDQVWEAVSVNELEIRAGMKIPFRRRNPVETPKELDPGTLVVRVWQQHPRYTGLADSAMRTVLDECEKLLLLTRADKAAARSRFAGAGMLFFPNELMPVSQQPTGVSAAAVDPAANPVYKNLVDSMITPIKDEQHPSGVVPVMVFGPAEYGERIRYITFDRPQAQRAQQQREESITRIATALDLPPEILTGKADLNHWAAWAVHEETFQQHLQPQIELIVDALTVGYLHPALKAAKVPDWDKYLVWYDDSELVVRPDKGQIAKELYAENAISSAAWRRETGFAEEDQMPDDEYAKRVGLTLMDEKLALTGKPGDAPPGSAAAAPGGGQAGGDSPTVKDKQNPPKVSPDPMAAARRGTPAGEPGPPKKPVTGSAGRARRRRPVGVALAQLDVELMTQLRTAASEVLVRELERAGARIRSKAGNNAPTRDLLHDVPNHMVASVLGPSVVASLDLSDAEVMKGAFSSFAARAAALITSAQTARNRELQRYFDDKLLAQAEQSPDLDGIYGTQDRSNRDVAMGVLLAGLTAIGIDRLYDPAPDAPPIGEAGEFDGLLVPADLIRRTVGAAGGSLTTAPDDLFEPEDFGGVGTGGTTYKIFADNGVHVTAHQWVYGPAIRRPFESHEELDGLEFSSWDDDSLAVNDGDEWIEGDFYHPGDHRGCLCAVAPVLDEDRVQPSQPANKGAMK